VGWKTKGGVPFGLTLFHNSQDALDIGWGKGWRSNIDFSVTYTGKNTGQNLTTAVVNYPDGRRLVFTYKRGDPIGSYNGAFYPPTGFYDVLVPTGLPNMPVAGWSLRTKGQMTYEFDAKGKLKSYRDRYGNTVTISRLPAQSETRIVAPDGNYIKLTDVSFNTFTSFGYHEGMALRYFNKVEVPGTRVWDIGQGYRSQTGDITLNTVTYPLLNGSRAVETFQPGYTAGYCAPILMETDALGRQWPLTYDGENRLKTFKLPVYGNNNSANPTYTYNYFGAYTEFVQPSGKKVTEYYDGGTLTQLKDQAGFFNTYKYDNYLSYL
jgi:hypothetical protein